MIVTRFGVNVFAFEFNRERPPPGAVLEAGVGGVDETLERLDVCVWGEGVEWGGWAFGGMAGAKVGVPGACSGGGGCPLGDMGRPGIGAPGGPCGGCCGGRCCGIHWGVW